METITSNLEHFMNENQLFSSVPFQVFLNFSSVFFLLWIVCYPVSLQLYNKSK